MMSIEYQTTNAEPGMRTSTPGSITDRPDENCSDCGGSGQCAICDGAGTISKQNEFERLENVTCVSCSGEGMCPACGGSGVEERA